MAAASRALARVGGGPLDVPTPPAPSPGRRGTQDHEDIHLPLQGLDYWSGVQWHHARGEFQRFGYLSGRELSPADPLLLLVTPPFTSTPPPTPSCATSLRKSTGQLVGIDERWRDGVRAIFHKRAKPQDRRGGTEARKRLWRNGFCASE
ncbi:MAG TPA: hypothetical protein VNY29_15510 [Terriglobales bacterium]|nr:hypothetical protein [Terriglobales bacterium]